MKRSKLRIIVLTLLMSLFAGLSFAGTAQAASFTNPGFESDSTGWQMGGAYSITSEDVKGGSKAVKVSGTGNWNNLYQTVDVVPNTDYTFKVWIKSGGTLAFKVMNPDWSTIQESYASVNNTWTEYSISVNSGSQSQLTVAVTEGSTGTSYIDEFSVVGGNASNTGKYHISNGKFYDRNGNEFIAKGANINGEYWPYSRESSQDAGLIADVWNFNTVRVNMFPRLEYSGVANYQNIDDIVSAYTSKGVIVIIENHDVTGRYPLSEPVTEGVDRYPSLSEMKTWWTNMASRFAGNDMVWFNPMNEPGRGGLSISDSIATWKTVNDELVGAIRAVAPDNIIILDEHDYAQANGYTNGDADSAVMTHGTYFTNKYSNIGFSLHIYSQWSGVSEKLNAYIESAQAKGLALHIGEFGTSPTSNSLTSTTQSMFNVVVDQGIGRLVWHWSSDAASYSEDAFNLTTGSNAGGGHEIDRTDGVKPSNLTWMGGLIWDDNHGTLSLPVNNSSIAPLANGSFESGLDDNWTNWGNLTISTAEVQHGSQSLMIYGGGTGGGGQFVVLEPGASYKLSAYGINNTSTANPIQLGVKYRIGTTEASHELNFNMTSWEYQEVTFTVPTPTSGQYLGNTLLYIWKPDADITSYLDHIVLAKTTEPTDPPADSNVALGKSVTASSQESANPGANAVDGDLSTRWSASSGSMPQTLTVDLGAGYNLNGSEINWELNQNYQYKIETSLDQSSWTTRVDKSNQTSSSQVDADSFSAEARYVRLTVTGASSVQWASVAEFKVYGTSGSSPGTGTNLAANPGFESADAWSIEGSWSRTTADAHQGAYSIGHSGQGNWSNAYQTINVTPNTDYSFTVYAKGNGGSVMLKAMNTGWSTISQQGFDTTGAWAAYTLNFNSGSNSQVIIDLLDSNANGVAVYVDSVSVTTN